MLGHTPPPPHTTAPKAPTLGQPAAPPAAAKPITATPGALPTLPFTDSATLAAWVQGNILWLLLLGAALYCLRVMVRRSF